MRGGSATDRSGAGTDSGSVRSCGASRSKVRSGPEFSASDDSLACSCSCVESPLAKSWRRVPGPPRVALFAGADAASRWAADVVVVSPRLPGGIAGLVMTCRPESC
ncbi:hypothetical protein GCM10020366_47450 [Saccharopolyspora gregorii]|uniref:Uncharacterized protein n=1 Tax=Saccharopolyspora gregorii TaxID=33914 RepID=A0ABP6RWA1_9PSEU